MGLEQVNLFLKKIKIFFSRRTALLKKASALNPQMNASRGFPRSPFPVKSSLLTIPKGACKGIMLRSQLLLEGKKYVCYSLMLRHIRKKTDSLEIEWKVSRLFSAQREPCGVQISYARSKYSLALLYCNQLSPKIYS